MPEYINFGTFLNRSKAGPNLSSLLSGISLAAQAVAAELGKLPFRDPDEEDYESNIHGERQSYMDLFADKQFLGRLQDSGVCCVVVSEEQKGYINVPGDTSSKFIVALDPLDGSANIDVNIPTGTIFSVFEGASDFRVADRSTSGKDQIAAGYFLYGPLTLLVFADADGVNGFTLDPGSGEFLLTHPNIYIPPSGTVYAVNDGNYHFFSRGIQNYIRYCRQQVEFGERPYSSRYSGSMVADIHRILLCGGIFLYPELSHAPNGKLRLAYECSPMAYIIEKAGGKATTGNRRTLDVPIKNPHQRSAVVIGSRDMVTTAEQFLNFTLPVLNSYDQ